MLTPDVTAAWLPPGVCFYFWLQVATRCHCSMLPPGASAFILAGAATTNKMAAICIVFWWHFLLINNQSIMHDWLCSDTPKLNHLLSYIGTTCMHSYNLLAVVVPELLHLKVCGLTAWLTDWLPDSLTQINAILAMLNAWNIIQLWPLFEGNIDFMQPEAAILPSEGGENGLFFIGHLHNKSVLW